MPLFLALDQSTSATKAILFDGEGKVVDRASLDHEQLYPQPGWVEHDAEAIWQNTLSVLKDVLSRDPSRQKSISCLSITNQRETIVVFDSVSGKPLHNAMVWQCRRGVEICEEHIRSGLDPVIQEKTGLKLDAYFSASKLQHLVRKSPEIKSKLEKGEALIGTIDAYLIYRLTRGKVFATDHTNACRTLLYDIRKLDWDDELCHMWEIPRQALPEPRDCTAAYGETDLDGFLETALPIVGVMGDSHASLFAHRCFSPGMSKVTFGTGSSIMMNIGDEPIISDKGIVSTLAWVHKGRPAYAFEGIVISSAATVAWLRDQLNLIDNIEETESMATELTDNGGVYLVPAFSGLGLPYWEPDARAAIVGLSGHSDKRHIVRAALEAIAYQIRDALEAMRQDAGTALQSIHGDGGPTRNKFLMQFTSDVTGINLRVSTVTDCSPLGAALAGMIGTGYCETIDNLARIPRQEQVYQPDMEKTQLDQLVNGWQAAVRKVLQQ